MEPPKDQYPDTVVPGHKKHQALKGGKSTKNGGISNTKSAHQNLMNS